MKNLPLCHYLHACNNCCSHIHYFLLFIAPVFETLLWLYILQLLCFIFLSNPHKMRLIKACNDTCDDRFYSFLSLSVLCIHNYHHIINSWIIPNTELSRNKLSYSSCLQNTLWIRLFPYRGVWISNWTAHSHLVYWIVTLFNIHTPLLWHSIKQGGYIYSLE